MKSRVQLDTLHALHRRIEAELGRMLADITKLARLESPSGDKDAVDRAVRLVEGWALTIGGATRRHSRPGYGDILEVGFKPTSRSREKTKPILLLGHLDTVWGLGTLAKMRVRQHRGRLYGPGVYDMKAGVVMALTALRALLTTGLLNQPVKLLLVSEEEVGSPVSRAVTEKIARTSQAVYVLEPAQGPQGAYKTSRKGVGEFRLTVRGVASHSGVDFEAGHSAVLELARQIERISGMVELDRGLTLNPGVIAGGTRSNVVAGEAWVAIDVRVRRQADAGGIVNKLRSLRPFDRACTLEISGGMNRPPMERTPGTVKLYRRAATLAKDLGFTLQESATGGGSDGNFTSALGLPTLDGMGAVGQGAHASDESILIDTLVPRTVLLAAMLLADESAA